MASGGKSPFGKIVGIATVVGLALIAIPLAVPLIWEPDAHSRWHILFGFAERLGDALLIAVVLAVFIERSIGDEHFYQSIVDIFGRKLPPELVGHLQNYFRWDFVRRDWNIQYEITPIDENGEEFILTASSNYTMENRSEAAQPFEYRYSVEVSQDPSFKTEITEATIAGTKLTPADIARKAKPDNESGYLRLSESVVLQPSEDSSPVRYAFHSKSTQRFRGEKVSPYWVLHPVVGTTFRVYYPEKSFNVVFDATFENTSKGEPLTDRQQQEHLVGKEWKIKTPILRGQGFVIRCTPKPLATGTPRSSETPQT
jgi:hypothetical protein